MTRFEIDLNEKPGAEPADPPLADYSPPRGRGLKVLGIFAVIVVLIAVVVSVSGFVYWSYLKSTPQYSLALIVDAARRDDQKMIEELVDTDAIVDDFVPQITDKAVELYGRGLAPEVVKRVSVLATPVLPFVKEKARAEIPQLLRDRTRRFENIPFWVMAAGADRYLDIRVEGDKATIRSKSKARPLEVTMEKSGTRWKIVAVRDEVLAKRIAERIGQQIIALVRDRGAETIDRAGKKIGLDNLGDILRKAEEIFE